MRYFPQWIFVFFKFISSFVDSSDVVYSSFRLFRLYVCNFWSQEKRLPTATLERMLMVLRSLYSCKIERCFLSLATNLLLEMTSQSPDFKRNMFEYPLSECTFQVSFCVSWIHLQKRRRRNNFICFGFFFICLLLRSLICEYHVFILLYRTM